MDVVEKVRFLIPAGEQHAHLLRRCDSSAMLHGMRRHGEDLFANKFCTRAETVLDAEQKDFEKGVFIRPAFFSSSKVDEAFQAALRVTPGAGLKGILDGAEHVVDNGQLIATRQILVQQGECSIAAWVALERYKARL